MKKRRKRLTIGLLAGGIMDGFTELVSRGVINVAKEKDIDVIVLPGKYLDRDLTDNRELMYEYQYNTLFSYANKNNLDGLIIAAESIGCLTTKQRIEEEMQKYKDIPCVLVASKIEGYPDVSFDSYTGVREGMDYLIEKLQCRKFAMLGGSTENADAFDRRRAFVDSLELHGIPFSENMYIEGDFSRRCRGACAKLLDLNPDVEAIFCINDETALGMYEELKERDIMPGRDVSVFGFDDTILASKAYPSLASVSANPVELGNKALRMVLEVIEGKKVENVKLPTKFVKRDSFFKLSLIEEEKDANSKKENALERSFDDIFYRCQHKDQMKEEYEKTKEYFKSLMQKILEFYNREDDKIYRKDLRNFLELFLNCEMMEYADVDNLLLSFENIYYKLKAEHSNTKELFELRDLFSAIYRKIVRVINHQIGILREEDSSTNYSMKVFIRDILQFEKGNDKSYSCLISNLKWLNIKNAYVYIYEKPITNLYKDDFQAPEYLHLKAVLREGKLVPCSHIQQIQSIDNIFDNEEINKEKSSTLVLLPLFTNEILYGLILCDLTEGLYINGDFFVNQLSSAAKMIYLLKSNESIQQKLEESMIALRENNIELNNISKSDVLTGILNRRGFQSFAKEMLEKNKKEGKTTLVIYADMNNLKIINDRYGHEEGDFSLKLIGKILEKEIGSKGVVARIGGDEFACVMEYDKEDEGREMLEKIYEEFNIFNEQSEKEYYITISAGACVIESEEEQSLEQALSKADERLYEVKEKPQKKRCGKI